MASKSLLPIAALAALAAPSFAQSQIFGVNLRGNQIFQSSTSMFVNNYQTLGPSAGAFYGLDFDASATTLYAVDANTREIFTLDIVAGTQTNTGVVINAPGLSGLSADANGTDWWLSYYDGTAGSTALYRGNILTGSFTLVGTIATGIIIDIAIDSQGNLYGFSISDDSLYSINTTTGLGSVIGPVGLNGNFAQGMDFDWSTDTLYATIYTGGGTGQFCSLDLQTGLATQLEDTFPLNAEMEMAVQQPAGGNQIGTSFCPSNPNSTGVAGEISASGSTVAANNDVTLTASNLPPGQFGIFVTSATTNAGVTVGSGVLCLGGQTGRYNAPGQILQANPSGEFSLALDLTLTPLPSTVTSVMAGDTRSWQAWHRDFAGMSLTSNFTNGVTITFN